MVIVDLSKKHFLSILVWDVFNHDGGAVIFATKNGIQVKFEIKISWLFLLVRDLPCSYYVLSFLGLRIVDILVL